MRIYNKLTQIAIVLAVSFFLLCSMCFGESITYAAPERGAAAFEAQNVIDDLKGSTLNGKTFSEADYQASTIKDLQLINFVEYGYFESDTSNYNLYFYIYNPQQFNIVLDSRFNQIEFRVGSKGYDWYDVKYLNSSGVLYKFKVELTSAQRSNIISTVDPAERVYEVSGVELFTKGDINATDYEVKNKFIYTGSGETLNCTSEGLLGLTLDVHNTNYRAKGTNGNSNMQDTLHSVYFSIPTDILTEYGEMTAIHARWLSALTVPMLVIGDKDWYDIFYQNAIENLGSESTIDYLLFTGRTQVLPYPEVVSTIDFDYGFNTDRYFGDFWCMYTLGEARIDTLYNLPVVLYAENGNAEDYTVGSDTLIEYFKSYTKIACNNVAQVADKYNKILFESYDTAFTEVNIEADETFSLVSQEFTQTFWQKLFGLSGGTNLVINDEFKTKAIQKVEATDFKATIAETCNNLFIGTADYDSFKNYYDTATANHESVYLFRYNQTEYYSQKAEISDRSDPIPAQLGKYIIECKSDNAYLSQQEVQLDFDIIDITCSKGDVVTIIGVVASPLDNFSPLTPPVGLYVPDEFWKIGCIILGVLAVALVASFIIKNNTDEPALVGNGYTRGSPPVINNYYGTTKKRRKR